jgi:hypothetical protein
MYPLMDGVIFTLNAQSCNVAGQYSLLHPARVVFNRKSFSHLADKVARFFRAPERISNVQKW